MTDKELHKLGRRELLQLLLAQGREAEKAKAKLAEVQEEMAQLEEGYERLKNKLNDKDAQISQIQDSMQAELAQMEEGYERLKNRLNDKDAQISQLRDSLQAARQGRGFMPEEELRMDFAQVRRSEGVPPPSAYPQQRPAYAAPQWAESAPVRPAPGRAKNPRHAQAGAEPGPPPRPAAPSREPQPAPKVMEVVQIVGGKLQPQSRMLLRPQRVEGGT